MTLQEDRRASFRLDVSIIQAASLLGLRAGRWPLNGVLHNLSAEGAQLTVLTSEFHAGQHIELSFLLGDERYDVSAEVRWARQDRRGSGQRVGVKFEKLLASERSKLFARLSDEQRRRAKTSR